MRSAVMIIGREGSGLRHPVRDTVYQVRRIADSSELLDFAMICDFFRLDESIDKEPEMKTILVEISERHFKNFHP